MNIGIKEVIALTIPYLITVAICYLFGYWGSFNINVLEYISFADVAKLAIFPLIASLVFSFAGILLVQVVLVPDFPVGGGNSTKIGTFGLKHWRWLISLLIFITIIVITYGNEPQKWFLVAMLISMLSTHLTHIEWIKQIIPNPQIRATTLFLILFLPTTSFAYGKQKAYFVKTGQSGQFVDITRSKLTLIGDKKNPVAYLGFLGNVYVLREAKTEQIVLVKQREDSPIFLISKP